jgi:hypothetical protein
MTTEQLSQLKNGGAGKEVSFQIASLLAYHCLRHHHDKNVGVDGMRCASWACQLALIPDEIILDIKEGKIKGLQNFNRLAAIQHYNEDYKF